MHDPFWYESPDILLDPKRVVEFIPLSDHTKSEMLNAIVRFFIYAALLFYVFGRRWQMISMPLMAMAVSVFVYYNHMPINDDVLCTRPTDTNPYMNMTQGDAYRDMRRKGACDIRHVKKEMDSFSSKSKRRYRNASALFEDEVSDWHFYTQPSTEIPNKQHDLANWLYNTGGDTCKSNPRMCEPYSDIRNDRDEVINSWRQTPGAL